MRDGLANHEDVNPSDVAGILGPAPRQVNAKGLVDTRAKPQDKSLLRPPKALKSIMLALSDLESVEE